MKRGEVLSQLEMETARLQSGNDYQWLLQRWRGLDEVELFWGLYPIAVSRPNGVPLLPTNLAGHLLFDLNPACQVTCLAAVRGMLDGWDVSLEEVPFYVCAQFGLETVEAAIEKLRGSGLSGEERLYLDTVEYWLGAVRGRGLEEIRRRRREEDGWEE